MVSEVIEKGKLFCTSYETYYLFITFSTSLKICVTQCCLFNYCNYLTKPPEHFNIKVTFAVLLSRTKFALKDKIFHNVV